MSREIRRLDPKTVERIAAGEVVERPASAVKELVENSVDADASRVAVSVENGGIDGIRVRDDGVGMDEAAVRRAVEEHTTSKIADVEDLEAGVRTLGFRGEALHAIGAVSRLTVTTKPRGGDRGTELVVEGGEVESVGPAGCPEGTTVEVEELFYNVPARRKYLKRPSTEADHVQRVVTGYALADPDVAVTFEADGRERFSTAGRGDLRSAVMAVYGREVASAMVEVDGADLDLPDGPLDGVSGLVSHPETTRASRSYCSTFVNGRYVAASAVREAVVDAYGTQLAPDRYPFAVVFLDVDPATVDVNVHPRKQEVRFVDEEGVREQVGHAVERALLDKGLIRSGAPRGRSAPEQTEISPERAEDGSDGEGATGGDAGSGSSRTGGGARASRTDDASDGARRRDGERTGEEGGAPSSASTAPSAASTPSTDVADAPASDPMYGGESRSRGERERDEEEGERDESDDHTHIRDPHDRRRFRPGTEQSRLSDDAPDPEYERLPSLTVLGQYDDTYLVCEAEDGLLLVDQHAADERVNYERLREAFADDVTTQALAEPVRLELTAREAALFDEFEDALASLGFHAGLVEERVAAVRTVPALLTGREDLVRDLLTAFVAGDGATTVEAAADALLADLACYPSITGNTSLTEGSVVDLLTALDDCENPYACPHGRPTVVAFGREEIAERFERDYPGHAGRRRE
ncbi:DNA mismatch repair endonuclease MutL [Halomarina ordinaria]|uniref:DNA mismatch repair protein MutL n=1 Tax=Halomarina ordinaria TaxID=3033939 RepID=A0ABD5U978_9EURY|nr:DNA mismatch repair endonuclease MutL [Halomarina sp. PSRA2]